MSRLYLAGKIINALTVICLEPFWLAQSSHNVFFTKTHNQKRLQTARALTRMIHLKLAHPHSSPIAKSSLVQNCEERQSFSRIPLGPCHKSLSPTISPYTVNWQTISGVVFCLCFFLGLRTGIDTSMIQKCSC